MNRCTVFLLHVLLLTIQRCLVLGFVGPRTSRRRSLSYSSVLPETCHSKQLASSSPGLSPIMEIRCKTSLGLFPPESASFFSSSLWTAEVEVFDGSTVVDPVVVSNVFWAGLKGKIISVIIGQILASLVFAGLASAVASQLPKLGNFVSDKVFPQNERETARSSRSESESANTSIRPPSSASTSVTPDFGKLLLCIIIDLVGSSSELIPVLGEVTDVAWAPIAAFALRTLYGSNIVFGLEFAEEILPLTDILPLATLCWIIDTYYEDSNVAKALSLGKYGRKTIDAEGAIDVKGTTEMFLPKSRTDDQTRK